MTCRRMRQRRGESDPFGFDDLLIQCHLLDGSFGKEENCCSKTKRKIERKQPLLFVKLKS